jgi:hypothetical protein
MDVLSAVVLEPLPVNAEWIRIRAFPDSKQIWLRAGCDAGG